MFSKTRVMVAKSGDALLPDAAVQALRDRLLPLATVLTPNPNDLLDMQKFDTMLAGLKKRYDYIILDSAPVMLVSDTLHLIEHADAVLYVVKSDFTEKDMIDFAYGFRNENRIDNIAFVLNSVKPENTRYGTTIGYGYYSEEHRQKIKWWKRFGL